MHTVTAADLPLHDLPMAPPPPQYGTLCLKSVAEVAFDKSFATTPTLGSFFSVKGKPLYGVGSGGRGQAHLETKMLCIAAITGRTKEEVADAFQEAALRHDEGVFKTLPASERHLALARSLFALGLGLSHPRDSLGERRDRVEAIFGKLPETPCYPITEGQQPSPEVQESGAAAQPSVGQEPPAQGAPRVTERLRSSVTPETVSTEQPDLSGRMAAIEASLSRLTDRFLGAGTPTAPAASTPESPPSRALVRDGHTRRRGHSDGAENFPIHLRDSDSEGEDRLEGVVSELWPRESESPVARARANRQRETRKKARLEGSIRADGFVDAARFNPDNFGLPGKAARDLTEGKFNLNAYCIVAGTYGIRSRTGVCANEVETRRLGIDAWQTFWAMLTNTATSTWPGIRPLLEEHKRVVLDLHRQYRGTVWEEYDRIVRARSTRVFEATGRLPTWQRDAGLIQEATRGAAPVLCSLCGSTRHPEESCPERFPGGFQPENPYRFQREDPYRPPQFKEEIPRCSFCHRYGHSEFECKEKARREKPPLQQRGHRDRRRDFHRGGPPK